MGRPFSAYAARRMIQTHSSLINKLKAVSHLEEQNKEDIKKASVTLAAKEGLDILRQIPVEELNREKHGIKTKILRLSRLSGNC